MLTMEILLVLLVIVLPVFYLLYKQIQDTRQILKEKAEVTLSEDEAIAKASAKAKSILLAAEKEALEVKTDAEKKIIEVQHKTDEEFKRNRTRIADEQKKLDEREKAILERTHNLDEAYTKLEQKERSLEGQKQFIKTQQQNLTTELEKIAQLTKEEAAAEIKQKVEQDLSQYVAKSIRQAEINIEKTAEERSKDILIDVMQKSATDYVAETTATTIDIPSEELKGKIIGKEGRNIRTFERLTGVDIIVDEAPNQVTLSCFDPIRREVAAIALGQLLNDGRVHPGAIEETIIKVKNQLAKEIKKNGEKIAHEAGFDDLPNEIVLLLGRFKYRFSYGQNLAKHSLEMVNIGGQLASEMGANVRQTKLACLLHDIGKVLAHEQEGKPHHHISGDIVRKYLKDEKLANAVESHHGDIPAKSIEAHIVAIADAISGSRPGARRNSHDDYIKRVRALEDIAKQYPQVKEAYAIHAGREVRVIIDPGKATDEETTIVAHKIAKEIENTQNYPGSVKVTAIREFRTQNEAK
jgi:ribonuclease Y